MDNPGGPGDSSATNLQKSGGPSVLNFEFDKDNGRENVKNLEEAELRSLAEDPRGDRYSDDEEDFPSKKVTSRYWRVFRTVLPDFSGKDDNGAFKLSGTFSVVSVFVILALALLTVKWFDKKLPVALSIQDGKESNGKFIEERARKDLHNLTSVGVRVTGYDATEIVTVSRITGIMEEINRTLVVPQMQLEYGVHRPTGAFFRGSDGGQISCYSNIPNVVARIQPANKNLSTGNAILVNCHFDTKPGSPGATDNMISCVTMLEIIRVLVAEPPLSLRNPIIFLFNGAEELGLQGAHGFVKGYLGPLGNPKGAPEGHEFASSVKTFINLEGAGGGGRELLFQTGPGNPWTLQAYSRSAPYPYGVVIGEEAFQIGLIPSDTDFRIFRDYGNLAGLDMAFIKNGWVYHTKWDRDSEVPAGSIQHMGANTLAILRYYSELDFTQVDMDGTGKMVYFDVLGLFMIVYPRWAGIVIDSIVALGTLGLVFSYVKQKCYQKRKLVATLVYLPISGIISWIVGIAMAALVAVFFNSVGYFKPFYSYPTIALIIFGIPAALAQTLFSNYANNGSPMQTWLSQKASLAIVLFIMTFITRAVFILTINLLFSVVAWTLSRYLCRGWSRAITLSALIVGEFIPGLMSIYLFVTMSDVFVPILGRSGSETNANLFFGVIVSAVVVVLIWNGFTWVFVQYRRPVLWGLLVISFFVVNGLVVFGFVGKVPYQEKTPIRLNIVNVARTWYEADRTTVKKTETGYWFWPYDSNTKDMFPELQKFVPELGNRKEVSIDYENCEDLYCAQPFMWPVESIKKTYWIPSNSSLAVASKKGSFKAEIKDSSRDGYKTVQFTINGPPQMVFVISPGPSYKLVSWTLDKQLPNPAHNWKGRPVWFIYHGFGIGNEVKFSCEFRELSKSVMRDDNDVIVTVQQTGFFVDGDSSFTKEFNDLVNRLPAWAYVMKWTAVLKVYDIKDS